MRIQSLQSAIQYKLYRPLVDLIHRKNSGNQYTVTKFSILKLLNSYLSTSKLKKGYNWAL